ncbi:MAG: DUF2478 domain-containing protein [Chloroflexi bacterium]|nr:DUF2478 domain-containing protein [Chloroflexota bacterium]
MSLVLLTAPSGLGKTTVCQALASTAQQQGWRVQGVLSPPQWQAGRKHSIHLHDLATGETRPLAFPALPEHADIGLWRFVPETVTWGNRVLAAIRDTDLLVIDEIGPLELLRGQGLQAAFPTVQQAHYRLAVVTVRPELAALLAQIWRVRDPDIITLTTENRDHLHRELANRLASTFSDV